MRYSEPLASQVWVFLAFLGVGFLLGAVYLWFEALRALFANGRRATVVCDLLFCLCAFAVLFSACMGYTDGVWRAPELLAAAGGFFLFRRSLAALLTKPLLRTAAFLRRFAGGLLCPIRAASARLAQNFAAFQKQLLARAAERRRQSDQRRAAKEKQTEKHDKKRKKHKKALAKPDRIQYNKY